MKEWKHISLDQRKVICSGIAHGYKLISIAQSLNLDPTSISKEVKRNRDIITVGTKVVDCKKTQRWPFVCSGCNKRYNSCNFTKYKYDSKSSQRKADFNLVNTRKGLDIEKDEFKILDEIIKNGVDNSKSIYQIKIE